jgi:hypothetical protein
MLIMRPGRGAPCVAVYQDDWEDDHEDVDDWERERRDALIESRHGIRPALKVACAACGTECAFVRSASGKKMLLHPGTGGVNAWLGERPGGNYIAVETPTTGFVVRNDHSMDELAGYRFYEHHAIRCEVGRSDEIRKRRESRRGYNLAKKYLNPRAPRVPPVDWEVEVPTDDR